MKPEPVADVVKISPAGRPSESMVVMTVTPEQKWLSTRRKSSGEITRLL